MRSRASRRSHSTPRRDTWRETCFCRPDEDNIFSQQLVNGVMLGSIYAMVGVALTLSIGVLKFLNFSIPGLFMLGGMVTWALVRLGMPWPLAAGAALVVAAAASLVVERFTWRWMRQADELVPLVSS